ncbi:C-type mannose receptor 2-like [Misgurnus anguillicaudatus]|uniref:C-type mannose receptor 2-like n=1 Tax=Misgurnus anguillicaudatus TaxID=75329 RepID=UPI003CCFC319
MERLFHVLLFSGLCPFSQSISGGYILIPSQTSWDQAQAYCQQNQFDLVTVQSSEDWKIIQATVEPALTSMAWVGLYNDPKKWWWSYKNETLTFFGWGPSQPNNVHGRQECSEMEPEGWDDRPCSEQYPFFCFNENDTGENRFVFINDTWMSWHDSQTYCRKHYTDLATIRSEPEHFKLMYMMMGYERAWLGLFRPWRWSDGTNVSTSSITWGIGQPDMTGTDTLCGAADPDGLIDDLICSNSLPFICTQWSKEAIVRLEVKSDKNLNDPAVMETILNSIKQKLKDHGIEKDTTLTWKVQPDGNVFTTKEDRRGAEENNLNQTECSDFLFELQ